MGACRVVTKARQHRNPPVEEGEGNPQTRKRASVAAGHARRTARARQTAGERLVNRAISDRALCNVLLNVK